MKYCEVCGDNSNNTKIIKNLCRRHYLQMYRHGKIFKTIYDPNDFIEEEKEVKIITRDKNGKQTNIFIIDLEDYSKIKNFKWYNREGYAATTIEGKKVFLHRMLFEQIDDKLEIDHIDGNTLNNKKENLRIVDHKQNIRNMHKNKIRGIKQVPSGKFQAVITVDYKTIYLGTFNTYELAVEVRRKAELTYFGEYVN